MWKQLSNWIHSVSNGWVALATLIIFLLFTALVLPGQTSRAEPYIGDAGSPDMSFYYTPDNLYQMAEVYGVEGRRAYVRARLTFDVIWPIVYTLFLSTAISWVYHRSFTLDNLWQRVNLVPVLGALFDYLENVATSLVMFRFPSPTAVVDVLAGVFTMVKWVFVGGSFVLLIVGLGVGAWQWLKYRNRE
jgi:hypothetical protein